jgi:hypothetical protein
MKILLLSIALSAFLLSCNDETLAPTTPVNDMVDMDAILDRTGMFEDGPYGSVTGTASLYTNAGGNYDVALKNFKTKNGPDLYVYLSKEIMPVNFISLGKLASTNGDQVYPVPATANLNDYKYICVHCKKYNHLFGYARIE